MQKVSIFFNPSKDKAKIRAAELQVAIIEQGLEADLNETQKGIYHQELSEVEADLIVVFGGDGTFLSTSRQIVDKQIPILGINHGHLGFLSEYGDMDLKELAIAIKEENFDIEERTVIKADLPKYGKTFTAVNDIAINRSHYSNLLYTDLYVDDNLLHSFRADGIVVCTPTGSTAYALSSGGAVMDPNIRAFEIVPIAAHSLSSRPHVISDTQTIVLKSQDEMEFFMQADGQELISLEPGTEIVISKHPQALRLVKLKTKDRNFYSILRDKMKWGSIQN